MNKLFLFLSIIACLHVSAQIGINTDGAQPDSSAVLDLSSTIKGFLPPRMTTAQRAAIEKPAVGLMVFNTDFNCVEYYHVDGWYNLCGKPSCTYPPAVPGNIRGTLNPVDSSKGRIYTIDSVAAATSYVWTVPRGWTITKGQGTNRIRVIVGSVGQRGDITVTAQNLCGISSTRSLAVAPFRCGTVLTDTRDSTSYQTVRIGEQCWFAENLKYLPRVSTAENFTADLPRYYVYDFKGTGTTVARTTTNYTAYGVLYNWPAAMQADTVRNSRPGGVKGVCPEGAHLPSDSEWRILENALGLCPDIGAACSGASGWRGTAEGDQLKSNDMGGSNSSRFSAMAAGAVIDGDFTSEGKFAFFWTSTVSGVANAYSRALSRNHSKIHRLAERKERGLSVRCIKD